MPVWQPAAIADLDHITAHIALDNPRAATGLGDLLIHKALLLDAQPMLGRVGRIQGTRELVVHPNYLLIYRIVGNAVEVLRVQHAAQKAP